jgi:hypothetical protein
MQTKYIFKHLNKSIQHCHILDVKVPITYNTGTIVRSKILIEWAMK